MNIWQYANKKSNPEWRDKMSTLGQAYMTMIIRHYSVENKINHNHGPRYSAKDLHPLEVKELNKTGRFIKVIESAMQRQRGRKAPNL